MKAFTVEWFDSVYRGNGPLSFPPWDIGRPQPEFVRLHKSGRLPPGRVFDAGCGTGNLAVHLAKLGLDVVGCDISSAAIDQACRKAIAHRTAVHFAVADVTAPIGLAQEFDVVVDSGTLQVFAGADRPRYLRTLHQISRPGAVAYVLTLSEYAPHFGPRGRSRRLLAAEFTAAGWRIETINSAVFIERIPNQRVAEILNVRVGQPIKAPAYLITARRPL